MTEASPAVAATPLDQDAPFDSVGILLPNTECKIADPVTGQPLGPGQDGELLFRGPQIMQGYLGEPASTAAAFDPEGSTAVVTSGTSTPTATRSWSTGSRN